MSLEKDPLIYSGNDNERALLALSRWHSNRHPHDFEASLDKRLNWPWIIMQALHHRTVCMIWENLALPGLLPLAIKAGLTKNWIAYTEQIYRASSKKNRLYLEEMGRVSQLLERKGIEICGIKGSALIEDIYPPTVRMLGDVDALVSQAQRKDAARILFEAGFKHGTVDAINQRLLPLSDEKRKYWKLYAHHDPKYNLQTSDIDNPFFRLSIGYNLFDPGDECKVPSEEILSRAVRGEKINWKVPDVIDTLFVLCAHVYREGSSATFTFGGENWGLWKLADIRSFLMMHEHDIDLVCLNQRIKEYDLEKPIYYALYYSHAVYGDAVLRRWMDQLRPECDDGYLQEIKHGAQRFQCKELLNERLFNLEPRQVNNITPSWAQMMDQGEWL